jgi:hypothetical protein
MMGDLRSQLKYNSGELKQLGSYVKSMEKFCSNTSASDECIKSILFEIDNAKQLISEYNTEITQLAIEPVSSIEEKGFLDALKNFKNTLN